MFPIRKGISLLISLKLQNFKTDEQKSVGEGEYLGTNGPVRGRVHTGRGKKNKKGKYGGRIFQIS